MIEQLNLQAFTTINSLAGYHTALDGIARLAAEYMPIIGLLYLAAVWYRRAHFIRRIVICALCSAVVGLVINYLISILYPHPRPFMIPLGTMLIPHRPGASFPSDHTTLILSISFLLVWFKETRSAGIVLTLLGLLGGVARVFCGVHFPLDIIGSCGVALISSVTIYELRNQIGQLADRFSQLIHL